MYKFLYKFLKDYALIVTIILTLTISSFFVELQSFFTECIDINQEVFRLHILANSNSDYDQNLKLLVRDKILELDNQLFSTKELSTQTLNMIKLQAESVLLENECYLPVKVEVTNMYFTTRFYENYTLPAGYYYALRVSLGDAVGDNWWCVLYPPLCLPAVSGDVEDILPSEQVDIITNGDKYEFRFALFELYSKLK